MGNLVRFLNQNRKIIYKWIIIIALFLLITRTLNWYIKNNSTNEVNELANTNKNGINNSVSNDVNNRAKETSKEEDNIKDFIEECRANKVVSAYEKLSENTKQNEKYKEQYKFEKNFINNFINLGSNYTITKNPGITNRYLIEIVEGDLLTSGNSKVLAKKYLYIEKGKINIED